MARVLHAVRVEGQAVVLGQSERQIHLGTDHSGLAAIDLAGLVEARVAADRHRLEAQWQERLEEMGQALKSEAARQLDQSEAGWKQQLEEEGQRRFEEGRQAGSQANEAEANQAVEGFEAARQDLVQERQQVLLQAEKMVVDLAVALVGRMAQIRVEADPKILVEVARSALKSLSGESQIRLKVNREDIELARKFSRYWVEKVETEAVLKVEVCDEVERGGCLIEGEEESVDARLGNFLERARQSLVEALEGGGGDGP